MITLETESLTAPAEGGSLEVAVGTNYDWSASSDAEWVIIYTPAGSKSDTVVKIGVLGNYSPESRSAAVTVISGGEASDQIFIHQPGRYQVVGVVHDRLSFPAPVIFGTNVAGYINWGDGAGEEYNDNVSHEYLQEGPYNVSIEVTGASAVSVPDIVGIEKVDLSGFYPCRP